MAFTPVVENFVITTDNTFDANLSYTPLNTDDAILWINGVAHSTLDASPHWTITGVVPTYSAANAGEDMKAGYNVKMQYFADV